MWNVVCGIAGFILGAMVITFRLDAQREAYEKKIAALKKQIVGEI
jgi:hypothetical protein